MKTNQITNFTGAEAREPDGPIATFLVDLLSGAVGLRSLSMSRELEQRHENRGYSGDLTKITIEPTGYETFTFEVYRNRQ